MKIALTLFILLATLPHFTHAALTCDQCVLTGRAYLNGVDSESFACFTDVNNAVDSLTGCVGACRSEDGGEEILRKVVVEAKDKIKGTCPDTYKKLDSVMEAFNLANTPIYIYIIAGVASVLMVGVCFFIRVKYVVPALVETMNGAGGSGGRFANQKRKKKNTPANNIVTAEVVSNDENEEAFEANNPTFKL